MSEKPILALDFDGVICASQREVFCTGLEAYAQLEPLSALGKRLAPIAETAQRSPQGLDDEPLYQAFQLLVPLGNRAEDFGVGFAAFDRGLEVKDQAAYDVLYSSFEPKWLARYHRFFYDCRTRRREQDLGSWLGLHEPYGWFCDLLRRRRDEATLAIATAKDRRSVDLLLDRFGCADLFDRDLVLDKETGVHKTEHLRALAERLAVPPSTITFVDDKVNHLERVAPLGVRPVLAGWGYNTEREHRRARELEFEVAFRETAESMLFPSSGRARQ